MNNHQQQQRLTLRTEVIWQRQDDEDEFNADQNGGVNSGGVVTLPERPQDTDEDGCPINFDLVITTVITFLASSTPLFLRGRTSPLSVQRCHRRHKRKLQRLSIILWLLFLAASISLARSVMSTLVSYSDSFYDWGTHHAHSHHDGDDTMKNKKAMADAARQSFLSNNVGMNDNSHHLKKERSFSHLLHNANGHGANDIKKKNQNNYNSNDGRDSEYNNNYGKHFRYGTIQYSPQDIDPYHNTREITLPSTIEMNLADVNDPFQVKVVGGNNFVRDGREDVPYFLHIPRSAGSTLKDIMGRCIHLTAASDVGARNGHQHDGTLKIIKDLVDSPFGIGNSEENKNNEGSNFVNVDTSTPEGIHLAKRLGLVESGMADVIITQYFHVGATLFNEQKRGRMFTMIRHPIERAVSMFHYLSIASWEPTYDPELAYISIEMYGKSKRIEHNWMVRFLTNELERDLTPRHLELAKEILRRKCIIGLLDEKNESWLRFQRLFGWRTVVGGDDEQCVDHLLNWGWSNKHAHKEIEEGSLAWNLLYKQNELDMMLYEYARLLFEEQAALVGEGGSLVT